MVTFVKNWSKKTFLVFKKADPTTTLPEEPIAEESEESVGSHPDLYTVPVNKFEKIGNEPDNNLSSNIALKPPASDAGSSTETPALGPVVQRPVDVTERFPVPKQQLGVEDASSLNNAPTIGDVNTGSPAAQMLAERMSDINGKMGVSTGADLTLRPLTITDAPRLAGPSLAAGADDARDAATLDDAYHIDPLDINDRSPVFRREASHPSGIDPSIQRVVVKSTDETDQTGVITQGVIAEGAGGASARVGLTEGRTSRVVPAHSTINDDLVVKAVAAAQRTYIDPKTGAIRPVNVTHAITPDGTLTVQYHPQPDDATKEVFGNSVAFFGGFGLGVGVLTGGSTEKAENSAAAVRMQTVPNADFITHSTTLQHITNPSLLNKEDYPETSPPFKRSADQITLSELDEKIAELKKKKTDQGALSLEDDQFLTQMEANRALIEASPTVTPAAPRHPMAFSFVNSPSYLAINSYLIDAKRQNEKLADKILALAEELAGIERAKKPGWQREYKEKNEELTSVQNTALELESQISSLGRARIAFLSPESGSAKIEGLQKAGGETIVHHLYPVPIFPWTSSDAVHAAVSNGGAGAPYYDYHNAALGIFDDEKIGSKWSFRKQKNVFEGSGLPDEDQYPLTNVANALSISRLLEATAVAHPVSGNYGQIGPQVVEATLRDGSSRIVNGLTTYQGLPGIARKSRIDADGSFETTTYGYATTINGEGVQAPYLVAMFMGWRLPDEKISQKNGGKEFDHEGEVLVTPHGYSKAWFELFSRDILQPIRDFETRTSPLDDVQQLRFMKAIQALKYIRQLGAPSSDSRVKPSNYPYAVMSVQNLLRKTSSLTAKLDMNKIGKPDYYLPWTTSSAGDSKDTLSRFAPSYGMAPRVKIAKSVHYGGQTVPDTNPEIPRSQQWSSSVQIGDSRMILLRSIQRALDEDIYERMHGESLQISPLSRDITRRSVARFFASYGSAVNTGILAHNERPHHFSGTKINNIDEMQVNNPGQHISQSTLLDSAPVIAVIQPGTRSGIVIQRIDPGSRQLIGLQEQVPYAAAGKTRNGFVQIVPAATVTYAASHLADGNTPVSTELTNHSNIIPPGMQAVIEQDINRKRRARIIQEALRNGKNLPSKIRKTMELELLLLTHPLGVYQQLLIYKKANEDGTYEFDARTFHSFSPFNALTDKDGVPVLTRVDERDKTEEEIKGHLTDPFQVHFSANRVQVSRHPYSRTVSSNNKHYGRLSLPLEVAPNLDIETAKSTRDFFANHDHSKKLAVPIGPNFDPFSKEEIIIGGRRITIDGLSHRHAASPMAPWVPMPGSSTPWLGPVVRQPVFDAAIKIPNNPEEYNPTLDPRSQSKVLQIPINLDFVKNDEGIWVPNPKHEREDGTRSLPVTGSFLPVEGELNTLAIEAGSRTREVGHDPSIDAVRAQMGDGTVHELADRTRMARNALGCMKIYYPEQYEILRKLAQKMGGSELPNDGSELQDMVEALWKMSSSPNVHQKHKIVEIGPSVSIAKPTEEQLRDTPDLGIGLHPGAHPHRLETISTKKQQIHDNSRSGLAGPAADAGSNRGQEIVPFLTFGARIADPGSPSSRYSEANEGMLPPPDHPAYENLEMIALPGLANETGPVISSGGRVIDLTAGEDPIASFLSKALLAEQALERFMKSDDWAKGDFKIIHVYETQSSLLRRPAVKTKSDSDPDSDSDFVSDSDSDSDKIDETGKVIPNSRGNLKPIGMGILTKTGLFLPISANNISMPTIFAELMGPASQPNSWRNDGTQMVPHVNQRHIWDQKIRILQRISASGDQEKYGVPMESVFTSFNPLHYDHFEPASLKTILINSPEFSNVPLQPDKKDFLRLPDGSYDPSVIAELTKLSTSSSYKNEVIQQWLAQRALKIVDNYNELVRRSSEEFLMDRVSPSLVADQLPSLAENGTQEEKNIEKFVTRTPISEICNNPLLAMELSRHVEPQWADMFVDAQDAIGALIRGTTHERVEQTRYIVGFAFEQLKKTSSVTMENTTDAARTLKVPGVEQRIPFLSDEASRLLGQASALNINLDNTGSRRIIPANLFPAVTGRILLDKRILGDDCWGKIKEIYRKLENAINNGSPDVERIRNDLEKAQEDLGLRQYMVIQRQIAWFNLLPNQSKLAYIAMIQANMYGKSDLVRQRIDDSGTSASSGTTNLSKFKNIYMRFLDTNPILRSLNDEEYEGIIANPVKVEIPESIFDIDPHMPRLATVQQGDIGYQTLSKNGETGPITAKRLIIPRIHQEAARAMELLSKMLFGEAVSKTSTRTEMSHISLNEIRELRSLLQNLPAMENDDQSLHMENPAENGIEDALAYLSRVITLRDSEWDPLSHDKLRPENDREMGHSSYMEHAVEILKHYFGVGEIDIIHTMENLTQQHLIRRATQDAAPHFVRAFSLVHHAHRDRLESPEGADAPKAPTVHSDQLVLGEAGHGAVAYGRVLPYVYPDLDRRERLHRLSLLAERRADQVGREISKYVPRITNPDPQITAPYVPSLYRPSEASSLHSSSYDMNTGKIGIFAADSRFETWSLGPQNEFLTDHPEAFLSATVPEKWQASTLITGDNDLLRHSIGAKKGDDSQVVAAKLANFLMRNKLFGFVIAALSDPDKATSEDREIMDQNLSNIDIGNVYRRYISNSIILTYDAESIKIHTNDEGSTIIRIPNLKLSCARHNEADKSAQETTIDAQLSTSVDIPILSNGNIDMSPLFLAVVMASRSWQERMQGEMESPQTIQRREILIKETLDQLGVTDDKILYAPSLTKSIIAMQAIHNAPRSKIVENHRNASMLNHIERETKWEIPIQQVFDDITNTRFGNNDRRVVWQWGNGRHAIVVAVRPDGTVILAVPSQKEFGTHDHRFFAAARAFVESRNRAAISQSHAAEAEGVFALTGHDTPTFADARPKLSFASGNIKNPSIAYSNPLMGYRRSDAPLGTAESKDAVLIANSSLTNFTKPASPHASFGGFFIVAKMDEGMRPGQVVMVGSDAESIDDAEEIKIKGQQEILLDELKALGADQFSLSIEEETQAQNFLSMTDARAKAAAISSRPGIVKIAKIFTLIKQYNNLELILQRSTRLPLDTRIVMDPESILQVFRPQTTINRHSMLQWTKAIALQMSEAIKINELRAELPESIFPRATELIDSEMNNNPQIYEMIKKINFSKDFVQNVHVIPRSLMRQDGSEELSTIGIKEVESILQSFPEEYRELFFGPDNPNPLRIIMAPGKLNNIPAEFFPNPDVYANSAGKSMIIDNNVIYIDTTQPASLIATVEAIAQVIDKILGQELFKKQPSQFGRVSGDIKITNSTTMQEWLDVLRERVAQDIAENNAAPEVSIEIAKRLGLSSDGKVTPGEDEEVRSKAAMFILVQSMWNLIQNNRVGAGYVDNRRVIVGGRPNVVIPYESPFLKSSYTGDMEFADIQAARVTDAKRDVSKFSVENLSRIANEREVIENDFKSNRINIEEYRTQLAQLQKMNEVIPITHEQLDIIKELKDSMEKGVPMRIAIRAVAGAGKTSTMTLSIASAIYLGIPMDQILSLTFARDAADNFADRLKGIGIQAGKGINGTDRVLTNTFHGMIKSLLESVIPLQLKGTKVNTELKMKQLYVSEDEPDPYFDHDGSGNFVKIDGLPADIANEGVYGTNLIERVGEDNFRQVNDPQQDPVCVRIFEDLVHKENGRRGQKRDVKARIRILMSQIQMWKSAGLSSRNVLDILAEQGKRREIDETEAMAARLYGPYQRQLQNHRIVEQGDHFIMMLNILNRYPELAEKWLHEKFKFILIDEAQDLNGVMLKILDHLVGPNTHVAFVGDPDQSIMSSFRGGVKDVFEKIRDNFSAHFLDIAQNLRSNANIVGFGNAYRKSTTAIASLSRGEGPKVLNVHVENNGNGSEYIIPRIDLLLKNGIPTGEVSSDGIEIRTPIKPSDVMIITRTNESALSLYFEFLDKTNGKIPVQTPSISRSKRKKLAKNLTSLNNLLLCSLDPFNISALFALASVKGWNLFATGNTGKLSRAAQDRWKESISFARSNNITARQWMESLITEFKAKRPNSVIKTETQRQLIEDILHAHTMINDPETSNTDVIHYFMGLKENPKASTAAFGLNDSPVIDGKYIPFQGTEPRLSLFGALLRKDLLRPDERRKGNGQQIGELGILTAYIQKPIKDHQNSELARRTRSIQESNDDFQKLIENIESMQEGRFRHEYPARRVALTAGPNTRRKTIQVSGVDSDGVMIRTAHNAKGLEARFVMICDKWPSPNAERSEQMPEEQRVFYVAASRAMNYLEIVTTNSRTNRFLQRAASPFMERVKGLSNGTTQGTQSATSQQKAVPIDPLIRRIYLKTRLISDRPELTLGDVPPRTLRDIIGKIVNRFASNIRIRNLLFPHKHAQPNSIHNVLFPEAPTIVQQIIGNRESNGTAFDDEDGTHGPSPILSEAPVFDHNNAFFATYVVLDQDYFNKMVNVASGETRESFSDALGFDMKFDRPIKINEFKIGSIREAVEAGPDTGDAWFNEETGIKPVLETIIDTWASQIIGGDHGLNKDAVVEKMDTLIQSIGRESAEETDEHLAIKNGLLYLRNVLISGVRRGPAIDDDDDGDAGADAGGGAGAGAGAGGGGDSGDDDIDGFEDY